MLEWLQSLTPEFYILFGFSFILLIFLIVILVKLIQTNRRIGTQDFNVLESISKDGEEYTYHVTLVNKGFTSNQIDIIGITESNIRHILRQEEYHVGPRSKVIADILMEEIESLFKEEKNHKKVYLFAENEIGLRNTDKCKKLNNFLKRRKMEAKNARKLAAKKERFETGTYNGWERTGLFIKLLFRPFYKLGVKIKHRTNLTLKEAEVRRAQKAEHDKIKYKLEATLAKSNEIKVHEESAKENKTRETELELLKQEKVLEIESLKQKAIIEAYEAKRQEINAINPKKEVNKYFKENPINYDEIYQTEEIDDLKTLDGVDEPSEDYLEKNKKEPVNEKPKETLEEKIKPKKEPVKEKPVKKSSVNEKPKETSEEKIKPKKEPVKEKENKEKEANTPKKSKNGKKKEK
ncbi:MAG: hypothetical protein ACOX02_02470 [Acholeplasmatales bacterium]